MTTKAKLNPVVLAALALDNAGALQYQVEFDAEEAIEFARHAQPHSEPTGTLLAFIAAVNDVVPRCDYSKKGDITNPNNGTTHQKFAIGKEYKRVVYVNIVTCYFSGAAIGAKPTGEAAKKVNDLIEEIEGLAWRYGAGEVSGTQDDLSFSIRVCFNKR